MKLNFPGVPVYMNGRNWYIPALSMRDLIENYESLTAPVDQEAPFKETVDKFAPAVLKAIQRNYPEFTLDNLLDFSDAFTFPECVRATRGASGLTSVSEGE